MNRHGRSHIRSGSSSRTTTTRSRLTVFFRLILAIPHYHLVLPLDDPDRLRRRRQLGSSTLHRHAAALALHRLMCAYVRYSAHLSAYLYLVGNPYPGFMGERGEYPIDVRAAGGAGRAERAGRRSSGSSSRFRRCVISAALGGSFRRRASPRHADRAAEQLGRLSGGGGAARRDLRVPRLVRVARSRAHAEGTARRRRVRRSATRAQTTAYLLLVTDRYPNADPTAMLARSSTARRGIRCARRRRRRSAPLAADRLLPAAAVDPAPRLARALGDRRVLRGDRQLVRDALPRHAGGRAASLHLALHPLPAPRLSRSSTSSRTRSPASPGAGAVSARPRASPSRTRQNRWKTGFRIMLAIPAFFVDAAPGRRALHRRRPHVVRTRSSRGAAPWGLRNLSAYALRYDAQTNAYFYLVTDALPAREPARRRGRTTRRRDPEPRGAPPRSRRRSLGGRGVAALAVVAARATTSRTSTSTRSSRRTCCTARSTTAGGASLLARADRHAARGARLLRPLRRALDARVGGRPDRHRDAARDDRLRPRLGRGAAVRGARRLVAPPLRALRQLRRRRRSGTGSRSGAQFVLLCVALAIVMGLARVRWIGDRWWLPAAPVFVGLRILLAFVAPWLLGGRAFHAPYVATARAHRARPRARAGAGRLQRAERVCDRPRPEPARLPLEADRRAAVHASHGPLRARARARPSRAQPHLEVDRLVRALRLPARVPARARDQAARRDGSGRGGPARDLRLRRPAARVPAAAERRHAPPRGRGRLVGATRDARPDARAGSSSGCSRRRRSTTRTRRGGTTSSSRTTRRSCSGSR